MKIFLDSCVILSRMPRKLLIMAGRMGLIELSYSQSVEDESINVARKKGLEQDIAAAFVELRLVANKVEDVPDIPGLWLPDENDRHVVLGAIAAGAEIIATENLRDFPKAALLPFGLVAKTPDQILLPIIKENQLRLEGHEKSELKRAKLYRVAKSLDD